MKLQNEISQLQILKSQNDKLTGMVKDYVTLLSFENSKFSAGDNTMFELNAWEMKLLEGQNKLVKTQSKSALTYSKLFWYSNSWSTLIN
jgi:hypothetical protein